MNITEFYNEIDKETVFNVDRSIKACVNIAFISERKHLFSIVSKEQRAYAATCGHQEKWWCAQHPFFRTLRFFVRLLLVENLWTFQKVGSVPQATIHILDCARLLTLVTKTMEVKLVGGVCLCGAIWAFRQKHLNGERKTHFWEQFGQTLKVAGECCTVMNVTAMNSTLC